MKLNRLHVSLLLICLAFVVPATADEGLKKLPNSETARLVSVDKKLHEEQSADGQLITERYADETVKIKRHVIRDLADNDINHGSWKKYDTSGNLVIEGRYRDGLRHGTWNAWYHAHEAAMFNELSFRHFEGPFISQATFADGQLDGSWTIYDSKQRKISQWSYSAGQRHGLWQWWLPNGKKMQQLTYRRGVADGVLKQFNSEGEVTATTRLEDGRRLHMKIEKHADGTVKSKVSYLLARRVPTGDDDWSKLRLAPYKTDDHETKHGPSESWYSSGKPRKQSYFDHGIETGEATWWHKNGQMSLRGKYVDGDRDGLWTWWHANGQKSIEGHFAAGRAVDRWVYWSSEGDILRATEFANPGGVVHKSKTKDKTATRANDAIPSSRRKSIWH